MARRPRFDSKVRRAFLSAALAVAACGLAATAARGEPRRWTTVAGKSQVAFEASFPLATFAGRSEDVAGDVRADPNDLRHPVTGTIRVNSATVRTGLEARDREMWKVLAVDRYPEMRFTLEHVEASFPSVTDRSDVLLTISGRMLIHGVERPAVFPGRVRQREDKLWVRGESELRMSEFRIEPPRKFFLKVSDTVLVSFDLLLVAAD